MNTCWRDPVLPRQTLDLDLHLLHAFTVERGKKKHKQEIQVQSKHLCQREMESVTL